MPQPRDHVPQSEGPRARVRRTPCHSPKDPCHRKKGHVTPSEGPCATIPRTKSKSPKADHVLHTKEDYVCGPKWTT